MFHFLFSDKEYYRKIWNLAIPLILQNAINASINLIDSLMIGSLGDVALGSVNICNQFYFYLFNTIIFGLVGGGAILNAQYWGARDTQNIHRIMGIQLIGCASVGITFFTLTAILPNQILSLYSDDPEVIRTGAMYLSTLSISYLLFPITNMFASAHRCTGNTRVPMFTTGISLILKVILSWIFIFGHFGFPAMGVKGAAIGTLIARSGEFVLLISLTYLKKYPVAATFRNMFDFQKRVTRAAIKNILPVMINEGIWGLGTNVYSSIYANISTASIAAVGAVSPIDSLMFTIFLGVGDACGIMTGNLLGSNEKEKAYTYSKRSVTLSILLSLTIGSAVFLARKKILGIYSLSPEATDYAAHILAIMAACLWARTTSYTLIIGVLRAGGDVRFCLIVDSGCSWFIGIPIAFILANVFHQPISIVYFGVMMEEIFKSVIVFSRFISRKWMNNLAMEDIVYQ